MQIKDGGIGELSQKLYDTVTGIQLGKIEDTRGWVVEVK
jgi:branched-chain amino acid aminotransferase